MKAVGMIHRVTKEDLRGLKDFKYSNSIKDDNVVKVKENMKTLGIILLLIGVFSIFVGYILFAIIVLWASFVSFVSARYHNKNSEYDFEWKNNEDNTSDICSDPAFSSLSCNIFHDDTLYD